MLEYEAELIGEQPQNLVVFLHGYNGTIEDHDYALSWLRKHLKNAWLCIPRAPEVCDKNPNKKQWFGMIKYDAENRRFSTDTTTEEIIEIYNQTQADIAACAVEVNEFIRERQHQYGISANNTYVIGFSQGAMLALFSALSDENVAGGVFMLSGLVAGEKLLAQEIVAFPHVYLFHGENDGKVQYKTLAFSAEWLTKHNITHDIFTYPELAHKMCEDEIRRVCEIINKKTAENQ